MPKHIELCIQYGRGSGVDITWTPTAQRLDIGGWYDHWVGFEHESMTLREFFDRLGITKKACERAWKEVPDA